MRPNLASLDPGGAEWRATERQRLIRFAQGAVLPDGGFAWLADDGRPDASQPLHLWINTRMTHVFGLEWIHFGSAEHRRLAQQGIDALSTLFEDRANGGWYDAVSPIGEPVDASKMAYGHGFVVIAASTGTVAGLDGAPELLDRALSVVLDHFWEPDSGAVRERFLRPDWRDEEPYRGANANMHMVEALLTASAALGDADLAGRALSIAGLVIGKAARAAGWRVVEHFDEHWRPLPEFNAANRRDHFRPYGLTIGHWLEWSRLLIAIEAMVPDPPGWLLEAATALFENAVRVGWTDPSLIGCPYTVGWDDQPIVDERLFWVSAEAVLAADALVRRTSNETARAALPRFWREIDEAFVDRTLGAWHSELDRHGTPTSTIWSGKPDVYHAYQACLFPDLPLGLGSMRAPGSAMRGPG